MGIFEQSAAQPHHPFLQKLIVDKGFRYKGKFWSLTDQVTRFDRLQLYGERILSAGYTRGLEIGTFIGLSTVFVAEALDRNGGTLDTIDHRLPEQRWGEHGTIRNAFLVAEMFVREAELQNVTFIKGKSYEVLPNRRRSYDFALIDGDHNYYAVLLDFLLVDSMLEEGGLIVLDDVSKKMATRAGTDGGPGRLLPHIFASCRYEIDLISGYQALCRKLRSADV